MKRLLVAAAVLGFLWLSRRMPDHLTRLMERMLEQVMPKMMDACFARMGPERRRFMLDHCQSMLDKMQSKYAIAQSPATETTSA